MNDATTLSPLLPPAAPPFARDKSVVLQAAEGGAWREHAATSVKVEGETMQKRAAEATAPPALSPEHQHIVHKHDELFEATINRNASQDKWNVLGGIGGAAGTIAAFLHRDRTLDAQTHESVQTAFAVMQQHLEENAAKKSFSDIKNEISTALEHKKLPAWTQDIYTHAERFFEAKSNNTNGVNTDGVNTREWSEEIRKLYSHTADHVGARVGLGIASVVAGVVVSDIAYKALHRQEQANIDTLNKEVDSLNALAKQQLGAEVVDMHGVPATSIRARAAQHQERTTDAKVMQSVLSGTSTPTSAAR